jgi:hypothetical protein
VLSGLTTKCRSTPNSTHNLGVLRPSPGARRLFFFVSDMPTHGMHVPSSLHHGAVLLRGPWWRPRTNCKGKRPCDLHDFAKRYQKHTKAIAEAIRDEILRDHTAIRKRARSEFSPLHVLYFPLACTMRSNERRALFSANYSPHNGTIPLMV